MCTYSMKDSISIRQISIMNNKDYLQRERSDEQRDGLEANLNAYRQTMETFI